MKDSDRLPKANSNDLEETNGIVHKAAVQGTVSPPDQEAKKQLVFSVCRSYKELYSI